MSEEIAGITQENRHRNRIQAKNESNKSLLSIIHDKNKTIEKLQKQLHFQKLQLKYYLGRTFRNPRMLELSKSCNPLVIQGNIPIALALNRFCVQIGMKSKMVVLYERMCNIDGRINNLLNIQEYLLRKVVGKICQIVKKESGQSMQIHIRKMLTNPDYVGLFNNLLNATLGLRKNLDTFRICSDRLLVVEEEKNSIAEHVYSLPIEQRTNCNYLIGIQIEKVQLQNRMKEILKDQSVLQKRIVQLNEIEGGLKNSQEKYRITNRNCTEHINDILQEVNFEAMGLIRKSNEQREKYTKEIVKLKCENKRIVKMLEQLWRSIQGKEMSKDSLRLDAVYSAGLYQALDKEINQAIQDNEMNKDSAIQRVRNKCGELSRKLQNVQNENGLLERELELVKEEYSEARLQWERELEAVQREKNDYKAQVEDLQAIRAAYAQLVDRRDADAAEDVEAAGVRPNTKAEEDGGKVREVERENLKLALEVAELKDERNEQISKLKRLSSIIFNLKLHHIQELLNS